SKDRLLINVDGIIKSRKDENDIIITLEKNNYIHLVSCARG
ncbi:MAG: MgtC/SapB family protein, partial [Lactobacillus iners]|nr:MgtC/SapB family protein [Lactobacillus iners]MCT7706861.1 MgtC/SapB family protein [Lactobacillus iners]